ncbi:VanZ family protein [Listeria sp. PSOL-1]|uniref:VanZ family protein n=1 Tax=Listeria sp. PSOL-1 TaxID=1844999 RepID=UPI0013D48BCB|nr:VanZ family protein [Listeria sp. PSOL-1]
MVAIEAAYYFMVPLYIICAVIFLIVKYFKRQEGPAKKKWIDLIFIAYWLGLIAVTFFPMRIVISDTIVSQFPLQAYLQMVPFATINGYLLDINFHSMVQLFGNIIMLMPLAIYLNVFKKWSLKRNILFAFSFSLGIECVQIVLNLLTRWPNKVADIDDIICNVAGYMIALLFVPLAKRIYKAL